MKRAVLLLASTLLAGCNTFPDVDFLLNDPAVAVGTPGAGQTAPGTDSTGSADEEGPEAALRAYANRPAPLPKRKPVRVIGIEPDRLVGMTHDEVRQLIGDPALVADRPPATVWGYRSVACALEIYFYLDVGSKTFRALTYQMKSENGEVVAPPLCLGQIRAVSYGS